MSFPLRRFIGSLLVLLVITAALWLLRDALTLANFVAIYLLAVLVVAVQLGTRAAALAAVVSFLCINFFLTRPYYTFLVADPHHVIGLSIYLIVAVIAGQLAARARELTFAADQRAFELEVLFRFTGAMNRAHDAATVTTALAQVAQQDLHARTAEFVPLDAAQPAKPALGHGIPIRTGEQTFGTLYAVFDGPPTVPIMQTLNTCASQAAMALQRIELAERVAASQRYEQADRLKTAILRAVSHDLRTPITVIKSSAANLHSLLDRMSPDERREVVGTIEHEADHLNQLVGDLLDLSRLQAGALTLRSELNSLEEVAGDVAARNWRSNGAERMRLEFPDDVPYVSFDYGLVLQAVSNIVENALRYEPPESQIVLRGESDADWVRLKIINHGETITPAEREHVMEPFFRGSGGQSGLGLTIAKGLIEAHHGTLTFEDTPGGGATFIISLPVKAVQVAHEA